MKKILRFLPKNLSVVISVLYIAVLLFVNVKLKDYHEMRPNWEKGSFYMPYADETLHLSNMLGDTTHFNCDPSKVVDLGDNKPGISRLMIAEKIMPVTYDWHLDPSERNISITYEGLGKYKNFKKLKASFNPNNVSHIGNTVEGNTLHITMPIGTYTIYAIATDAKDALVYTYPPIKITIQNDFMTSAFYFPAVFVFLLIPFIYLGYRIFKNQKIAEKNKQLALESERNKISADLHDEIGATISSILINSSIVKSKLNSEPQKAAQTLDAIIDLSKELSQNIGDMVWSLKAGENEFMTLRTRIINFINFSLGATDINYTIFIDRKIDDIKRNITLRKNILMIVKEAINNILKHSQAENVKIHISCTEGGIFIEIEDDGIGFDSSKSRGNGTYNLKYRATESGGNTEIMSSNTGTRIKTTLPFIP